jgi:hypothetical protein
MGSTVRRPRNPHRRRRARLPKAGDQDGHRRRRVTAGTRSRIRNPPRARMSDGVMVKQNEASRNQGHAIRHDGVGGSNPSCGTSKINNLALQAHNPKTLCPHSVRKDNADATKALQRMGLGSRSAWSRLGTGRGSPVAVRSLPTTKCRSYVVAKAPSGTLVSVYVVVVKLRTVMSSNTATARSGEHRRRMDLSAIVQILPSHPCSPRYSPLRQ